jgi:AcrR family transcriptional regulator
VLAAALQLFSERTWEGTNIPDIAERAGVAVGSVYRYFPSKEALGSAVFAEAKQALADAVITPEVGAVAPATALRMIWRNLVAFAAERPEAFAFLEHQQHIRYLDADAQLVVARLDEALSEIVAAAQAVGAVRPGDPMVLISMVFGAFVGVTKLARASGEPLDRMDLAAVERAAYALLGMSHDE